MSKEATIIQSFNDIKRQYEYSVKGYDVTESVKILLKKHKEAYDKEKKVFAGIDGYLEAQKEYQSQIADLQSQLAEKEKEKEFFKEESKINKKDADYYFDEYRLYKHKLAEKEKEIEELHTQIEQMVKDYTSEIAFYTGTENQKAIEQLEKVKEFFLKEHRDEEMDTDYLITKDAGEIADFLLDQIKQLKYQQINELKGRWKMSKNIDIDNEEEILKECDFYYFYNSENCSSELCAFYNDIFRNENNENFDKRQALIDLGRIGIVLNNQSQQIAKLKAKNEKLQQEYDEMYEDVYDKVSEEFKLNNGYEYQINSAMNEIEKLQQQLKDNTKQVRNEVVQEIIDLARKRNNDQFYIIITEILDQLQSKDS